MKITAVFGPSLYAVQYDGEEENEFERLMGLWMDVVYLGDFAASFGIENTKLFIDQVSEDAEELQDFMNARRASGEGLEVFFQPFHNQETGYRVLSLQKGRPNRKSYLRLYAIQIDAQCYRITGGAIKLFRTMQESEALMQEWQKMKRTRAYLQRNGVFDDASFQDFKTEQDEND